MNNQLTAYRYKNQQPVRTYGTCDQEEQSEEMPSIFYPYILL
jgi:hypothetical protein